MEIDVREQHISRYRQLANRISFVRWGMLILLFGFVFLFEVSEHLLVAGESLSIGLGLEIFFFGIFGPTLVWIILTWIGRNLNSLAAAYQQIQNLNANLESRIQKQTQELAHANTELLQLDQLKSEFVSLVSHELRAPLTNIQGGLELVLSNADVCPLIQDNLIIIQREVQRLIRLVQEILDVSVFEAGQVPLNCGPIALRPLLKQIIEQTAQSDDEKYRMRLVLPSEVKLVLADEDRVRDSISSLLQNAVKYSPDGGEIRISLDFDDDFAYITVKDQGVGISSHNISHITEKFRRGHTETQPSGYGLGLYFVEKFIEAQGGSLKITSEGIPGKGSAFTVSLPVEKETLYERDPAY